MLAITIGFFITGMIIGSFINALEYRTEKGLSINGRSFCPHCKHQLAWYDLIPVFSWVSLRGKCRYCSKAISKQYPLIELVTAVIFTAVVLNSNFVFFTNNGPVNYSDLLIDGIRLILLLAISSILILIALHDAKTGYILSGSVYIGMVFALIYLVLSYLGSDTESFLFYLLPHILSATVFAGIFFLVSFFSKEKYMGAGDAEIAFLIGLLLGWPATLTSFALAVIVGSIFSLALMARGKANLKSEIPFGPFLVMGAFLAYFFNDILINFYVRIFLSA
jgi:prepilin signal peptidase PulO-like enzyme (type II secretory pathway)